MQDLVATGLDKVEVAIEVVEEELEGGVEDDSVNPTGF